MGKKKPVRTGLLFNGMHNSRTRCIRRLIFQRKFPSIMEHQLVPAIIRLEKLKGNMTRILNRMEIETLPEGQKSRHPWSPGKTSYVEGGGRRCITMIGCQGKFLTMLCRGHVGKSLVTSTMSAGGIFKNGGQSAYHKGS